MADKTQQIETLIELNDELENYFRNTIIPQLYVDAQLILKKFTPRAMKQFTLAKEDIGKYISDIKDNFRFPTIEDNIIQVIDSQEIMEKEIQTIDGRWYQMNIIPYIEIKSKKANGVIITFVETTSRIKDLRELESLIADHETLLDIISHDIRGPLSSLLLAVELFKDASTEKEKDLPPLGRILENAVFKMTTVINELTDTRKKAFKDKAERELVKFEDLLHDVRLTLSDKIEKSGAIIKDNLSVTQVTFSRMKLRSIIYNLVSNAIKFIHPDRKPEILITTGHEKGYLIISVKDNGSGIDAKKHDDIFSKYYRDQNSIEGTGIGLYLVKQIVENSGGKIEVISQMDTGSEFKVYLKE